MFQKALIALGVVLVLASSGCVVYDTPCYRPRHVVVYEERPCYRETTVYVHRGYCR